MTSLRITHGEMLPALALALLSALAVASGQDDQYCLARDHYPYLYFGTKTAYERVYDHKDSPQNVPYCRPLSLWLMARPGTRSPDSDLILKMQDLYGLRNQIRRNHEEGRHAGRLCPEDLAALAHWHLNVTEDRALVLTGQGQADLSFLAKRLQRRLPELFNSTYSPGRYKFRYTKAQRTQESAEAFASGLFGNEVEMPAAMDKDPLLQFDELCPAWRQDQPRALKEVELFESGPEMAQTLARVSRRLGFAYNLSLDNVDLMWEMCRYDKAWRYVSLSAWCAAFTEDDLKVMEYRADLQYYYSYSYGNTLNAKLGCPPVKDMMDHFARLEAGSGAAPAGVFYFTHDAALHMMLAALGVARDEEPLLASNMDRQAKRQFRTSFIGSFAANLAAVFYQCDHGERHKVMFYLRERIVDMEGCQVGLCSWSQLRTRLDRVVQGCDLSFCHTSGATTAAPSAPAALPLLAALATLGLAAVLGRDV